MAATKFALGVLFVAGALGDFLHLHLVVRELRDGYRFASSQGFCPRRGPRAAGFGFELLILQECYPETACPTLFALFAKG